MTVRPLDRNKPNHGIKVQAVILLSGADRTVIFLGSHQKDAKVSATWNKMAICPLQIETTANCWNNDCRPLFVIERNSKQRDLHMSLFIRKLLEIASPTNIAFKGALEISFLWRHREALLVYKGERLVKGARQSRSLCSYRVWKESGNTPSFTVVKPRHRSADNKST